MQTAMIKLHSLRYPCVLVVLHLIRSLYMIRIILITISILLLIGLTTLLTLRAPLLFYPSSDVDGLQPSDKIRKYYLKVSNRTFATKAFLIAGAISTLYFLATVFLFYGKTFSVVKVVDNYERIVEKHSYTTICIAVLVVTILLFVCSLLTKPALKLLKGTVFGYYVVDTRLPKEKLMEDFKSVYSDIDNYVISVHDDWVDITINWKQIFDIDDTDLCAKLDQSSFAKYILIHDDYTYEELDRACGHATEINLGDKHLQHSVRYGHFANKVYDYTFDYNGLQEYKFKVESINNTIHKFLANRGYKSR